MSNEESLLVLVRVYGENTEDFIDRDTEHLVSISSIEDLYVYKAKISVR